MKKKKIVKVFIDGEVLVLDHFSGIGHYTAALLKAVDELLYEDEFSHFTIEIGLPIKLKHHITRFGYENFRFRSMSISPHISNGLKGRNKLPPIDLIYGKRVYVFPNYSSWPTLFSPIVPIIYDLSFIHYPQFTHEKGLDFLVAQTALSVRRAKRVITISNNSKKEICEYYDIKDSSIDVIYPVLNRYKFYRRSVEDITHVRAKYGVFDDYVLFVGNLEPRKNLVSLLKAYDKLDHSLQKKYALLLVGAKGWRDDEIHELILKMREKGIKIIQPTDYVDDLDLPALISGAKAFAYVSVYEGFGIPPTEAMACGVPVISSYNSSLPEAVGDAALRVDALNITSITKALKKILTNDKLSRSLIDRGYSHIERFITREIAIKFLESIEKAAK